MQGVGFERFAGILFRYSIQRARADEVHSHAKRKNSDGHQTWPDGHGMEEQALKCLPDNVKRREQQKRRLDERGKTLHFSVAVEVLGVGGLVGHKHGDVGNYGGDQIQNRVQRFRKNAQASGDDGEKNLQKDEHDG